MQIHRAPDKISVWRFKKKDGKGVVFVDKNAMDNYSKKENLLLIDMFSKLILKEYSKIELNKLNIMLTMN